MLSKDHFYFGMFRKYIVAFSHIISDIHVLRTNENNQIVKDITVPITYASKSKLFYYLQRNSNVGTRSRIMLPRISFIINSMAYDVSRKLSNLNECFIGTGSNTESFQYVGIPYNFTVDLNIWSVYMDDLLQIIEQLATFFKPDYSMTVNEIEEFGVTKNIPVILQGIDFDIENEFEEEDRLVRANATFEIKGYLYPSVSEQSVIHKINIAMRDLDSGETHETIKIDWDDINQTINTEIVSGQAFYEFNSVVNINTSTVSTGDVS